MDIPYIDIDLGKQDMKILKSLARELRRCVRSSLNDPSAKSTDALRKDANSLMDEARERLSEAGAMAFDRVVEKQTDLEDAVRFAMALDNVANDCRTLVSRKPVVLNEI